MTSMKSSTVAGGDMVRRLALGKWEDGVGMGRVKGQLGLTVLVTDQHFAVEQLIVAKYVVEHLLIEVFRRGLEGYFHSSGFLGFEINVASIR